MRKAKGTMKAMKAMKKKVASGRLAKAMVLRGSREKTSGGLKSKDIMKNKYGKCVSKKASARGRANPWSKAIQGARKALGIKGFVPINSGPEGKALYAKAKVLYKQ